MASGFRLLLLLPPSWGRGTISAIFMDPPSLAPNTRRTRKEKNLSADAPASVKRSLGRVAPCQAGQGHSLRPRSPSLLGQRGHDSHLQRSLHPTLTPTSSPVLLQPCLGPRRMASRCRPEATLMVALEHAPSTTGRSSQQRLTMVVSGGGRGTEGNHNPFRQPTRPNEPFHPSRTPVPSFLAPVLLPVSRSRRSRACHWPWPYRRRDSSAPTSISSDAESHTPKKAPPVSAP
ncbi:hypothetical protein B0T11DRAFT_114185 [Plectosphaerella cucumerina]|uniref:Secreted protein n=1 Tax=Plectosphaerella cucumerina TaxID=40658 RepID=A0A8K0TGW0_9PEZI|nr:hypothetical protein B0T11DRAFT_114185 [Plectosphaerella cucumerina]